MESADTKGAKAPTKKYRFNQRQALKYPQAVTLVPFDLSEKMGLPNQAVQAVALSGVPYEKKLPDRPGQPGGTVTVPGATQEQLAYLYKAGTPHIEEYEE